MDDLIHYASDAEVARVVQGFETCASSGAEFNHARHLTVLVWYLSRSSEWEALSTMREGLLRFSAYHNVPMLYHETITAFWVRVVGAFLRRRGSPGPVHTLANEVVSAFGNKNLIYQYYSHDRLISPEARASWMDPDLRPLDER